MLVIRHAFTREQEDTGRLGLHADSTAEEILSYTGQQSVSPLGFRQNLRDSGSSSSRRWRSSPPGPSLENRGEVSRDGALRYFDLAHTRRRLADLRIGS